MNKAIEIYLGVARNGDVKIVKYGSNFPHEAWRVDFRNTDARGALSRRIQKKNEKKIEPKTVMVFFTILRLNLKNIKTFFGSTFFNFCVF